MLSFYIPRLQIKSVAVDRHQTRFLVNESNIFWGKTMEKSLKISEKKSSEEHITDEERRQLAFRSALPPFLGRSAYS